MANPPGYEKRQVDILFLQVDAERLGLTPQRVPLSFGLTPKVAAGVQKAQQAFVSLLYTKKGSASNVKLGCGFLVALEQGRIRTALDARNYFALEIPELLAQVNSGAVYPDEILTSAVLQDVVVDRSKMSLRIKLQTAAGASLTFLAPV